MNEDILLKKLVQEVEVAVKSEEDTRRKARNKRKALRRKMKMKK